MIWQHGIQRIMFAKQMQWLGLGLGLGSWLGLGLGLSLGFRVARVERIQNYLALLLRGRSSSKQESAFALAIEALEDSSCSIASKETLSVNLAPNLDDFFNPSDAADAEGSLTKMTAKGLVFETKLGIGTPIKYPCQRNQTFSPISPSSFQPLLSNVKK